MGPGFEPLRAYAKRVARLHVAVGRPAFLGNFNSRGNPWAAYFGARRSAPASAPSTSGRKVAPQGAHGPCPTPLRPRRQCRAAVRRSFCSRSALKINFECAGNKIRVRRGEIFSALKMQPQRAESFIPMHRHPTPGGARGCLRRLRRAVVPLRKIARKGQKTTPRRAKTTPLHVQCLATTAWNGGKGVLSAPERWKTRTKTACNF